MKYINQLNIVLVLAATATVLYSFSETYWSAEQATPLEIERTSAPPPQQIDSRPMAPAADLNRRPGAGTSVDPETGLPNPSDDESAPSAFPPGNRQVPSRSSGSDSQPNQNPRTFSSPPSSSPTRSDSQRQTMPRWNPDRSAPPGAERAPDRSTPTRTRRPSRPPSGQTIFPGAEGQKREESQDPSPPPVRSSMPEQRPRR